MKTPMNVFNTAMKKKKKNRKGFSLVELIVVLVIMAILAAALIPSLTGYIKKTKEQSVRSECQSAVQAAQTIASGAYAAGNSEYKVDTHVVKFDDIKGKKTASGDTPDNQYIAAAESLAEVPSGTVKDITVDADGRVTGLTYTRNGTTSTYAMSGNVGTYS